MVHKVAQQLPSKLYVKGKFRIDKNLVAKEMFGKPYKRLLVAEKNFVKEYVASERYFSRKHEDWLVMMIRTPI
jgi:hypothetical protein